MVDISDSSYACLIHSLASFDWHQVAPRMMIVRIALRVGFFFIRKDAVFSQIATDTAGRKRFNTCQANWDVSYVYSAALVLLRQMTVVHSDER